MRNGTGSDCLQISVHLRSFHFPFNNSHPMILRLLSCLLTAGLLLHSAYASEPEPQSIRIADNVYALVGTGGTVTRENLGNVANAGFIVGPTGVIVIDTGTSYRQGMRLLHAIRTVTDRPVELVILTHAVQEFIFGAAAFEEVGATIAAHRKTYDLMRARCAHCLIRLKELLGNQLDGTRLVFPTRLFDGTTRICSGGVELSVTYFGWASTPGDIAIFHEASGTLFAGGMVSAGHVPTIRDADFDGWRHALVKLQALSVKNVVPGFGSPSGPEAIEATARYLDALDARIRKLYSESSSLLETLDQSDLAAYSNWLSYSENHRRNALHRQLQLEIEDLGGDPRSTALPTGLP